jgi:hypothetical protein
VGDDANEEANLHNTDHVRSSHKMSGFVKHFTVVSVIDQISENTGIDPYVNDQKKDQEQSGKRHYELFTYRRCEELRPFHAKMN